MLLRPKALIFDVNETLLDLSPMKSVLEKVLNGDATQASVWFSTLLHHSLVDTITGSFHNFTEIGAASLVMVAHANRIALTMEEAKDIITEPMTNLPPHDDVIEGLQNLSNGEFTLVALSNSSREGLSHQLEHAGIARYFPHILSVETQKTYKPSKTIYTWAAEQAGFAPHECMMVAAHGWDIAGAASAGLQTAFISRPGKCPYPLADAPMIIANDIRELSEQVQQ